MYYTSAGIDIIFINKGKQLKTAQFYTKLKQTGVKISRTMIVNCCMCPWQLVSGNKFSEPEMTIDE
jgi:hypothetical protein